MVRIYLHAGALFSGSAAEEEGARAAAVGRAVPRVHRLEAAQGRLRRSRAGCELSDKCIDGKIIHFEKLISEQIK